MSEAEVENRLNDIVAQADGIVLGVSYGDVDRFNSFFQVAKNNGRCLAISLRQARLLNALRPYRLSLPDLNDKDLLIFRRSKITNYAWGKQILQQYSCRVKSAFDLSKQQSKAVLAFSFYDLEELVELQPAAGSCYVLSASEPFNEEMEIDFERLVNWLGHYGLQQYHVHVSGHIMPLQLRSILEELNAAKVFPHSYG